MRVRDRDRLTRSSAHEIALTCVEAGIRAALPERAVSRGVDRDCDILRIGSRAYDLTEFDRILLFGLGKGAPGVARALMDAVEIDNGLVVTDSPEDLPNCDVIVGGHPLPDEGSLLAGERTLEFLHDANERTLVLAAVTGGGSALLEVPDGDLTLPTLRDVTKSLLDAGVAIDEINAVRKHCSRVKGGRLARAASPATVAVVVISDVVGDDLATVASGPFAPDRTTYADALVALPDDAPAAVHEYLTSGTDGNHEETPATDDPAFDRIHHHVLANGRTAVKAARAAASEQGYATRVLATRLQGEAREIGRLYPAIAAEAQETGEPVDPPAVVVAGGETTVTVRGDGDGGPNGECALSAARELPDGVVLACIDTDGRDGATDAAGALVDAETWNTEARDALARSDAGGYLRTRDALVVTGSTGTNVNDLHVLVVE